jgi:transposase
MLAVARRHAEVHALLKQGLNRAAIARRMNLRWATVSKYALAPSAEPLIHSSRNRTKLDPFLPFLAQRWSDGEHVAASLFNEIRAQGYRGKERTVRARLSEWRASAPPRPAEARLPGPRTLVWLLLRRPSDLNDDEREMLKQLCARSDEVANAHRLAQQFLRLVRDRPGGRKLDQWAVAVRKTGPPELRGFSRNLQRDWHAVSAGVTERWSSGPVEGHINKVNSVSSDGLDLLADERMFYNAAGRNGWLASRSELGRGSGSRDPMGAVPQAPCCGARPRICDSALSIFASTQNHRRIRA